MKEKKSKSKSPVSNQRLVTIIGAVVLCLGIIGGIFALGWHYGSTNQSTKDKKAIAAATATARSRATTFGPGGAIAVERHVFVGDVTKVSSTQLTINTTTGQTQTAKLDDKTIITSAKDAKATAADIKVGSHIFVTCTQNSDKTLTAQRVLVIH